MAKFVWTGSDYDEGDKGTFGKHDYIKALMSGAHDRDSLIAKRKSIQEWMDTAEGKKYTTKPGMKIRDWVRQGTDLGFTGYGSDAKVYGRADYYADLAQGKTSDVIRKHFTDTPSRLYSLGPNVFKEINTRADAYIRDQRGKGEDETIKAKDTKIATIQKAADTQKMKDAATIKTLTTDLGKFKTDLGTARTELGTEQARFKQMQTQYSQDLAALKAEKLTSRTNAPVAVGADSALRIRGARGPKFKATLASLTRGGAGQAASNRLKSTAHNI